MRAARRHHRRRGPDFSLELHCRQIEEDDTIRELCQKMIAYDCDAGD